MGELVSIIMPSYNTERFILQAIESVQKQTYQTWELIIVDDCSNDNTESIVQPYLKDTRIHYMKNDNNSGAAISRNRALREAKGRWIAFLDSDDIWASNKLEKQIDFMKRHGYSFSYTDYEETNEAGEKTGIKITGPKRITQRGMFNYCWPGCLTVMYDAKKIGLIQIKNIKKNNDYAMWLKICKKENCYLLDEYLAEYRKGRTGSISNNNYRNLVKWHYQLYKYAEEMSSIRSIIMTGRNIIFGIYKKKKYVKKTINK